MNTKSHFTFSELESWLNDRRVTEIESVYFRPGGGGPNNIAAMDEAGKPEALWFRSIPPAERLSRQQMISIADGYFTGLQKNDGKGIHGTGTYPFTSDCHRTATGPPTTNVPSPANQPPDAMPKAVRHNRIGTRQPASCAGNSSRTAST